MSDEYKLVSAPVQSASSELTITFRQFFYVVDFNGKGKKRFEGIVVLLPSDGHIVKWPLDVGTLLRGHQIDIFIASGAGRPEPMSRTSAAISLTQMERLPQTKDLFGRKFLIRDELLKSGSVPDSLNARFVLTGGYLRSLRAKRKNADHDKWEFKVGDRKEKTRLTDLVEYSLPLESGSRYWIVLSDGQKIVGHWPIPLGGISFEILNADTGSEKRLPKGNYTLHDYRKLHTAVLDLGGVDPGEMSGFYPGDDDDSGEAETRGTAEPICGGEQGDPDPPQDPPDPPRP